MPLSFFKFLRSRFIFSLVFPLFLSLHAQPLQFARERIEVEVLGEECTLTGTYYFCKTGPPIRQPLIVEEPDSASSPFNITLYYPFVVTPELPFPDSIQVTDLRSGRPVQFIESDHGVYFPVSIPPRDTAIYRVRYRQKTPSAKMEYILTSTQKWNRPLQSADFIIRIPQQYQLISLSPAFDRAAPGSTGEKNGPGMIYFIHRENFMPQSNLTIQWERKTP